MSHPEVDVFGRMFVDMLNKQLADSERLLRGLIAETEPWVSAQRSGKPLPPVDVARLSPTLRNVAQQSRGPNDTAGHSLATFGEQIRRWDSQDANSIRDTSRRVLNEFMREAEMLNRNPSEPFRRSDWERRFRTEIDDWDKIIKGLTEGRLG